MNGEFDSVRPIGGAPKPGSDVSLFEKNGDHSKTDANLILGVTQIMSQRWIADFNLSYDRETGYLNDPYKLISIIDSVGNTLGYLFEKRPGERSRKSAFLENRVAADHTMVALSMRYMTDDWGIHSETAQLRFRWWNAPRTYYLEPQLRWYQQTAASFYTPWLTGSDTGNVGDTINAASSDQRLSAFRAITVGLKYARKFESESGLDPAELSVRLQYYDQMQTKKLATPVGLEGLDLYPGLRAFMLQFEWKFQY